MYDLVEVREVTKALLVAVVGELPEPWPSFVDHEALVEHWSDPALTLSQSCGQPLITQLTHDVAVLGAFDHEVCDEPAHYRSLIIMRTGDSPDRLMRPAINGVHSLSGGTSLRVAARRAGWVLSTPDACTGSHAASAAAVQTGDADIASIDSVTWWLWQWHRPAAVAGLTVIGRGPLVPCLPLIAAPGADLAELRGRLTLAAAEHGAPLGLRGFVSLDRDQYRRTVTPLLIEAAT
jgi:ABC-type phosphate/phosphonate transport system substrate-binding protein